MVAQMVKSLPTIQETWVQSLGQEDLLEKENSNLLQYSCLENLMDRGAWWATVHWSYKEQDTLQRIGHDRLNKNNEWSVNGTQVKNSCSCGKKQGRVYSIRVHSGSGRKIAQKHVFLFLLNLLKSFTYIIPVTHDYTHLQIIIVLYSLLLYNDAINKCKATFKVHASSVQFSCSVVSNSLRPHGLQTNQYSLSITNSRSLLKLMSIKLVMHSNHLILCRPILLQPSIIPSIRVFSNESVRQNQVAKVLEFQLQHQSFQWIFRIV